MLEAIPIYRKLFINNYDYYYFEALYDRIIKNPSGVETIITGLSYGVDGVIRSELPLCLNFSMHSQDVFYDSLHIQRLLGYEELNIKTCIMCLGYYSLYYDLSLSANNGHKVYKTYYPIFGDTHNIENNKNIDNYSEYKKLYDEIKKKADSLGITELALRYFEENNYEYYGNSMKRLWWTPFESNASNFAELSDDEKVWYAEYRAELHNKQYKYKKTFDENTVILNRIFHELYNKGIRIFVCIMPFTWDYLRIINKNYKTEMVSFFDNIDVPIEFVDLNDLDVWRDEHFLNVDHLTSEGALLATRILNSIIS